MLTPPESPKYSLGLVSAAASRPRSSVAVAPGAGAISSSAVLDLLQTWTGEVNVPDRQTTVVAEMEFSCAAIQELPVADVLPPELAKVTVHEAGGATCTPAGVAGFGMRPSPSAGAVPAGSTGNELAVTGGGGGGGAGGAAAAGAAAARASAAAAVAGPASAVAAAAMSRNTCRAGCPGRAGDIVAPFRPQPPGQRARPGGSSAECASSISSHIATVCVVVRVA